MQCVHIYEVADARTYKTVAGPSGTCYMSGKRLSLRSESIIEHGKSGSTVMTNDDK